MHHQTVQRRVERALAYGALAALDDRPRPQPTITPEAKAWLVSLACDKAKEHGYAARIVTTRLFARHAREHGPGAGHECLARLVQQGRRNFFAVPTALASGDSTSTASAVVTTSSPRRALGGCARHRAGNGRRTKAVKLHKVMRATMAPSVMNLRRAPSAEQQCQAFNGVMNSRRWSYLPSGLTFSLRLSFTPWSVEGGLAEVLGSG